MQSAVLFLCLGLAVLATTCAQAQRSMECQMVWEQPTDVNDILDCLKSTSRIGSQWKYYMWTGFAALILFFSIFGLAVIFICRCCGCCGCCQSCLNPPDPIKRRRARCTLWMWVVFVILWACCVCVLVIYGASLLMGAANKLLDNLEYGTLGYFMDTKNEIMGLLTNYSTSVPVQPDLDLSAIDNINNTLYDKIHMIRNDYFKYFKIVRIVSYCVGAVGVALALLILVFAFCRCKNSCYPVLYSCIYYFFAIVFSLLAIVFTVAWYATTAACGEVTLQYKREPGIFQWYLVPFCKSEIDFESLQAEVASEVTKGAHQACGKLLEYCESDPENVAYDYANNPERIFMCGHTVSDTAPIKTEQSCSSLDDVIAVVTSTAAKPILSNMLCTNTTGWEYQEACTVVECATRCQDYKQPDIKAKTWTKIIVDATGYARNASTALSYVMPMMQCNFIVDKLAAALESPGAVSGFSFSQKASSVCTDIHTSTIMLGSGFFVGALMFIMGIYVLHRGSWIWPSILSCEQ